jgi:two-component system OmpR family response regulator
LAKRSWGPTIAKTLIIEDDPQTALYVTEGLQDAGHVVHWAATGADGYYQAVEGDFALIVADRMLPGLDGLTLVRNLRRAEVETPVLFLTTMDDLDARVEGLESGGDDYLTKPFAMPELIARSNALLRRVRRSTGVPTVLRAGELHLDLLARTASRQGVAIELQPQEFKLLEFLVQNVGRVVTRMMLLEKVWGFDFDPGTTLVESHLSRLRTKLDRGYGTPLIHTVRGEGYVLRVD